MLLTALQHVKTAETTCLHNCAEAVKIANKNCGYADIFSISCTETYRNLKKSENYTQIPVECGTRNDIIFFDWYLQGGDICEHIGIIEKVENNTVFYSDFNSSENPRGYFEHRTSVNNNKIKAVFHHHINNKPISYILKDINIHSGDRGSIVTLIQSILYKLGYVLEIDGYFGEETAKQVKKFQENNSLEVDGVVGSETLNKMSTQIILIKER